MVLNVLHAPFKVASSRLFWVSEVPYQITCGS